MDSQSSKSFRLHCGYGLDVARDAASYDVAESDILLLLCPHLSLLLCPPGVLGASEGLDILFVQLAVALPAMKEKRKEYGHDGTPGASEVVVSELVNPVEVRSA